MMSEVERTQVLKMVEAGTIDAVEGVRLLNAVGPATEPLNVSGRWLRIRVTDIDTQQQKISLNLPLSWVMLGMRIGSRFSPELAQIDMNEVLNAIRYGAEGRILEVEDLDDGKRIELFVD
jgi:hypothetical protein